VRVHGRVEVWICRLIGVSVNVLDVILCGAIPEGTRVWPSTERSSSRMQPPHNWNNTRYEYDPMSLCRVTLHSITSRDPDSLLNMYQDMAKSIVTKYETA
jgi:hypothetical protein